MNVLLSIKQIHKQSLFYIVSNTVRPKASKKAFNIIGCEIGSTLDWGYQNQQLLRWKNHLALTMVF